MARLSVAENWSSYREVEHFLVIFGGRTHGVATMNSDGRRESSETDRVTVRSRFWGGLFVEATVRDGSGTVPT